MSVRPVDVARATWLSYTQALSVELMYRSPVDLYLDEWFYELLEVIERTRARRVFIDSRVIDAFSRSHPALAEECRRLSQRLFGA